MLVSITKFFLLLSPGRSYSKYPKDKALSSESKSLDIHITPAFLTAFRICGRDWNDIPEIKLTLLFREHKAVLPCY